MPLFTIIAETSVPSRLITADWPRKTPPPIEVNAVVKPAACGAVNAAASGPSSLTTASSGCNPTA
ncbi:MAG: hypothetical protein IPP98_04870 [Gemmatimonadetes bacterium]|nr:hypothetical protein [Gemmatimonadota bacterium]